MSISAFQVRSFGYALIKGTRHEPKPIDVDQLGPVGDRRWCLVDDQCRVLKTVQHPQLLAVRAIWNEALHVAIPGVGKVPAIPEPSGEQCTIDYWKRSVPASFVPSELDDAFSQYLGKTVRLVRPERGAIVYGAPISIITTASVQDLGRRAGAADLESEAARFRATYLVRHDEAYIEDTWCGQTIRLGEVLVEVQSLIGRCAVIDCNPATGEREGHLLRALADYRPRNDAGEPCLGVQGSVVGVGKI